MKCLLYWPQWKVKWLTCANIHSDKIRDAAIGPCMHRMCVRVWCEKVHVWEDIRCIVYQSVLHVFTAM